MVFQENSDTGNRYIYIYIYREKHCSFKCIIKLAATRIFLETTPHSFRFVRESLV